MSASKISTGPPSNPSNGGARLSWLDTGRMMAAFFIIAHHSATDSGGKFFGSAEPSERFFPVFMRMTSELASTEFFFVISLFLLSLKLERRPAAYWPTMRVQARRLLVPFAFWAVFYAFWRLVKATHFGYEQTIWDQLSVWQNWLGYLTLGTSSYHMHFLPTLFLILLFHPILRIASKYPIAAIAVIPMLAMKLHLDSWVWGNVEDPVMRDYFIRGIKVFAYTGYGLLAYGLYGLFKKGLDHRTLRQLGGLALVIVFMAYCSKLVYGSSILETGVYANRLGMDYWIHYLMPVGVMLAFIGFQNNAWPSGFNQWSQYSFGLYLIHPAVLDVVEILVADQIWSPGFYVVVKYTFACIVSLSLSLLIASIKPIAWTIGLGTIPLIEKTPVPKSPPSAPSTASQPASA